MADVGFTLADLDAAIDLLAAERERRLAEALPQGRTREQRQQLLGELQENLRRLVALRAALKVLGPKAKITVVELVPAIVAWARGPMAELSGDSLSDPRVEIVEGDVVKAIAGARGKYDAILLDVDNGPEGLTRKSNDALYDLKGLRAAQAALSPGGVLAVWSSFPYDKFTALLGKAGFNAEEIKIRATGTRGGARHVIWLATKPKT